MNGSLPIIIYIILTIIYFYLEYTLVGQWSRHLGEKKKTILSNILLSIWFILTFAVNVFCNVQFSKEKCGVPQVLSVFFGPVLLVSSLADMQKIASMVLFISCFISVLLCELLIPEFGVTGAVWAAIFGLVFLNLTLAVLIKAKLGINTTMLNIIKVKLNA